MDGTKMVALSAPRTAARLRRTAGSSAALRAEVAAWLAQRRADRRFRRFTAHFDALEAVLLRMLDRLDAELADPPPDPGQCYERCRWLDGRLAVVRRLFDWYAVKYDQRLDDHPHAVLMRAADEVVRGCWQAAFVVAGVTPPTGPVCFLDTGTDGHSVRRCSVPADFRVPEDDPLAEFVARLPVPVVALPEVAAREPWWLVVAAHETGHHVQHDLDLVTATVDAVRDAAPADLQREWRTWSGEVFADVFSVLMVGGAAAWAVEELQFGSPDHLLRPVGPYPPPVVRSAVLGEVLIGMGTPAAGVDAAREWLTGRTGPLRDRALRHLAAVSDVVSALLGIPLGEKALRSLVDRDVLSHTSRVERWAEQLGRVKPVITPLDTRAAPRVLLAAAVHRHRTTDDADPPLSGRNLVAALTRSGAPGLLAGTPDRDLGGLADDLADLLLGGA
uniref:hypothetical protein n=1 Tax=Saccharothrix mutabilis TaxID=33921 RepID=UPI0031D3DAE3